MLNKKDQKKLYNELRQVLGEFDMELLVSDGQWLRILPDVDAFAIYIAPFEVHKPFTKGQK